MTARLGDEATRFDLSDYFTDPDGDHLVYRVANPAIVTVAVTGSIMAVTPVAVGTGAATVRATDPLGLHVEQTFTVTVSAADSAPVVTHPIADMTLTVGGRSETVTLSSHFQDPEQGELTFSASSGDTAVSTATVTDDVLTVTAAAAGSASVTVRATDQNGLTSAPAVFTVTGKSPVNVEIPDANLRPVVEQELGKEPGETITSAEMEHIRALEGTELDIEDLRGLEFATGLTDLNLGINAISDLTPLSGLTNLRNLGLRENAITDVTPVSDLTNLEEVDLDNNSLTDLTPLSGLANLIGLGLDWNSLTDVTPLSGLTSLTTLSLDHNSLTDLTPLSGLTNLTRLGLVNNSITDVAPLSGLTGLADLYLLYNSITDVTPLSGLTGLADLYLSNNLLTDLAPLSGMTNLTRLSLFNNEIRDVTPLSGLTNLSRLWLYNNCLTSIQALTNNGGLGAGDYISLRWNALDADTVADDVTALRDRGVDVVITETPTVEVGAPVNLNAAPGDGELTLTWAAPSGPDVPAYEVRWRSAAGTFNDWTVVPCSSKRRHKLTGLDNGTAYTVELRAAGHADNGVATVGATSGDPSNNAPVVTLSITDVTFTVGDEQVQISLSDHFTDLDGDSLEYSVVAPDIVTVAVTESTMTVTPVAVGTGAATATATDPGGLYAELTFTVTVSAADSAPVVTHPIADMTLTVGGRSETVILSSHFQDPEQGELTFSASSGDATVVTAALADGVLTVTAVAAGTTEVTVTASDVSGSPSEPDAFTVTSESPVAVEIPDANLRTAVEWELDKQAGEPISSAEMEHMGSFECVDCGIEDLAGLQFATGVTSLELGGDAITDVAPLSGLTNLTVLYLYGTAITNITPLSGLTNLTGLDLSSNAIADVTPLSGLTNLTRLDLNSTAITDITPLSGLTNLTRLDLSSNAIAALAPLSGLTHLTRVELGYNEITDVAPLSGLTTLRWLGLSSNDITDVIPLSGLTHLTGLELGYNEITDITPLSGLTNLEWLYLHNNCLTSIQALTSNTGLGAGDYISLRWNALDADTLADDVTVLRDRGVNVVVTETPTAEVGAPVNLSAAPGDGELTLTWAAPSGPNVPAYEVRWRSAAGTFNEWAVVPCSSKRRHDVTGLVRGTSYTVEVRAAGHADNGVATVSATPGSGFAVVGTMLYAALTAPNSVPWIREAAYWWEIGAEGAWPLKVHEGTSYEPPAYLRELEIFSNHEGQEEGSVRIRLSASSTGTEPPPPGTFGEQMAFTVHDAGLNEALLGPDGLPLVTAELHALGDGWFYGMLAGDTGAFWNAIELGYDRSEGLYVELAFSVSVRLPNEPPVVMLPIDDMTLTVGGLWETVNLASHFRDTVEEELTYAASSGDPAVVSAVVADGVLTVTAVAAGSAAVTVTASDPSGLSSDEVFTVIAQSPVNVEIPDAGLRAAVESELGKDAGATISSAEMEFIDSLEGIGWNIEDLTGLEFATGLTELELGDNAITDIAPLSGLTNLRDLHLYVNALTDVTLLSGLTGLASVDLSDNEITEVAPLSGLTGLTSVDLSGNEITDVTPLSGLTNLTQLFLGRNQITDVTPLAGLTNLTRLHLRSNQITDVTPLSGLTNLTQLDLYNNALTDATPLAGLTNLTSLFFSSNALTDVSVLSGLSKLRTLFVSDDMLTDVSALSGLSKLTSLSLSSDALADVSALSGLTNLRGLWLSGSALTEVSALSGLTTLTQLDLSESAVTDIAPLSGLSSLIWLSLSHNEITEVTPVSGLTNLKLLDLTNNTITDIAPLSGLSSLTTLNLSHNEITDVTPLAGLTYLRWLYLDSNCLTNIEALTSNTGLGGGDYISLEWNALDADTLADDVTALRDRGATVEVSETPSDEIGAPTGLSATPGDHELALTWDSPWIQGHVTYNVRWRSAAGTFNEWTVVPCSSKRRYKLTGLTNGTTYTVEVRAAGHADNGVASVSATPND